MRAEMLEDYETALGILDKILEEDEANSQVHRNSIRLLEWLSEIINTYGTQKPPLIILKMASCLAM